MTKREQEQITQLGYKIERLERETKRYAREYHYYFRLAEVLEECLRIHVSDGMVDALKKEVAKEFEEKG